MIRWHAVQGWHRGGCLIKDVNGTVLAPSGDTSPRYSGFTSPSQWYSRVQLLVLYFYVIME